MVAMGPDSRAVARGVRPRILVVDDEPWICHLVQRTLEREQYDLHVEPCSPNALERLQHEPFDLLITDINMPELSGLELAEEARAIQPLLGIVVMTAYGSFENVARAIRTGISDFIIKPFDIEDLRQVVTRSLQRQQLQRDNMRFQTLLKVFEYSEAINSTLELDALYEVVTRIMRQELGATSVVIATVDASGQLRREMEVEVSPRVAADLDPLLHRIHQTGKPHTGTIPSHGVVLGVPLRVRDERFGVLLIAHDDQDQPALLELLGILGNQAALAIRNARQYNAVRELDQRKSEFVGIASHELRTPLSLVLGYGSMLRNRFGGRDRELLQHVIDGAQRMSDIVDELLLLHHADTSSIPLHRTRFDLWGMVREVVAELSDLAASRGVELSVNCPATPTEIAADREKLSLALAHLVDNATKFNHVNGTVQVSGSLGTVDGRQRAIIDVQDSGIGISAADLPRVYDRFYQTEPSATRLRNGLGIGLAVTKVFVELHGGKIDLQSVVGHGTDVRLVLPVDEQDIDWTI
jgi:signal transduction histidine kinase